MKRLMGGVLLIAKMLKSYLSKISNNRKRVKSVRQLKVGDKFVVVREWVDKNNGWQNSDGHMDEYLGQVLTVESHSWGNVIFAKENDVWSWDDSLIDWQKTNAYRMKNVE